MRIDFYATWSNARQNTVTGLPDSLSRDEIVKRAQEEFDAIGALAINTAAVRTDGGAPLLFVYRDGRVRDPQ